MVDVERDVTDLGLPRVPTEEELAEARRQARLLRGDVDPGDPDAPAASESHRARLMRSWRPGATGPRLRRPCGRCGADVRVWCRKSPARSPEVGFVHDDRDADTSRFVTP